MDQLGRAHRSAAGGTEAAEECLVGLLFRDTRVLGVPVPLHRDFEEVNLHFYVRREVAGESRRAVTFIKEIVPRLAIAAVARLTYNEPYVAIPMRTRSARSRPPTMRPAQFGTSGDSAPDGSGVIVHASGRAAPLVAGCDWRSE